MPEDLMFRPVGELAAAVRAGEVSARELVEASLRGDRPPERRAERVRDALRGARPRRGGRRVRRRRASAGRRADRDQGPGRADRGRRARRWACGRWRTGCRRGQRARAPSALRGSDRVGKTNTPEMGILPVTEPDRFGPARNPWDTVAHAGRLVGRQRRGGGLRHGAGRARQRRRRLDPHPGRRAAASSA